MSAKKLVGFLIPLKAISPRNLTSLGLVAVFFAVYVICGGKIQSVPRVPVGKSFGGVRSSGNYSVTGDVQNPSTPRKLKNNTVNKRYKPPVPVVSKERVNKSRPEEQEGGSLQSFQDRINNIGRGNKR